MNEFFTWQFLATFAGATAATSLLTQWLKTPLKKLPTQWLSYIIAVGLLVLATAATQWDAPWQVWAIIPFNAVTVSLSANGAYSAIERVKTGQKIGENGEKSSE